MPHPGECMRAFENIDPNAYYYDGHHFSVGNCFVAYDTNGVGKLVLFNTLCRRSGHLLRNETDSPVIDKNPVSGQTILDAVDKFIDQCYFTSGVGSMGTANCEECHVKVNYRHV
jgi:hypothetical protein